MIQFQTEKISNRVTRIYGIYGAVGEQMYLVEGKDKAALIDTGSGVGDLERCIRLLTKLPVTVLLTHAHFDHAMGAPQFDEVFMSFLDKDLYREHASMELRKACIATSPKFADVEDGDYVPVRSADYFRDLRDGDTFDLGGLTIEAVSCAGHSPGSMMFLIHEERALIAGDACNFFTMMQDKSCLALSTFEKNLKSANERTRGKYNKVFLSHARVTTPVSLIGNVLEVCREIKEGRDDKIPFDFLGTKGFVAKAYHSNYMRTDGGFGNIVYNPDRIWE